MCPYKNDEGEIIQTEEVRGPQGHKVGMRQRDRERNRHKRGRRDTVSRAL